MRRELASVEDKLLHYDEEPHLSRRRQLEETIKVIIPDMMARQSRILPDPNLLAQLTDQQNKFRDELTKEERPWLENRVNEVKRRIAIVEDEIVKLEAA